MRGTLPYINQMLPFKRTVLIFKIGVIRCALLGSSTVKKLHLSKRYMETSVLT